MGWVEDIHDQTVAVDTAPFIYFIEESPKYLPIVEPFFTALSAGKLVTITSIITLLEILVRPQQLNQQALVAEYQSILTQSKEITLLPFVSEMVMEAVHLRTHYGLRTPDAMQLATAIVSGANYFLTNDKALQKVTKLKVLILDEL